MTDPLLLQRTDSPCDIGYSSSLSNNLITNFIVQETPSISRGSTLNLWTSPMGSVHVSVSYVITDRTYSLYTLVLSDWDIADYFRTYFPASCELNLTVNYRYFML